MQIDAEAETERMARQFEAEALGEAQWCSRTFGTDTPVARGIAAVALERAAINLRNRKP
jgi:hypothetical protein